MTSCENCGIPQGTYSQPGYWLTLQFMPQVGGKWTRQQKRTVWTCGSACAVQTMAIAAMGLPSHKWHMTLKEFTSQMEAAGKLDFLKGQTAGQTIAKTRINSGLQEAQFDNLGLDHSEGFVTRKGGRPPAQNPSADTLRKRRQRQRDDSERKGTP
jgi:hypothetical protein